MESNINYIFSKLSIAKLQISKSLDLLNEGASIPFIARYRKETTGNLDEVEIEEIQKWNRVFQDLMKRKETILKVIEEQGKLSSDLRLKIENCFDLTPL